MKIVAIILVVGFVFTIPFIIAPKFKITIDDYYVYKEVDGWEGVTGPVSGEPITINFTTQFDLLHDPSFKVLPIGSYGIDHPVMYTPLFSDKSYIFDFDTLFDNKFNITLSSVSGSVGSISALIGTFNSAMRNFISNIAHYISSLFGK